MTSAAPTPLHEPAAALGGRRHRVARALKLAGLSLLGLCSVSIPVTLAVVLSATGSSDILTLGDVRPVRGHATPARAVSALRCNPTRGYYALTFEDGPVPGATRRVVAALRASNAVATFFDVGRAAASRPDLVELQRRVGQVAGHGYTHADLGDVSDARRLQELQATARVLDYPNVFFRPPYGVSSPALDADLRRTGLVPVYWTLDLADGRLDARAIAARALSVEPGGILLLHEGSEQAVEALPKLVAGLRRRGMCPGFLATTRRAVVAPTGVVFHVTAVRP